MRTGFPELHRQVVFGQSGGKIIWQPRIGCWYTDKKFAGEAFPAPYTGMDLYEIYRELDCSARLYEYNACFRRVEHPSVTTSQRALNETDVETTIHTPAGKQVAVRRRMTTNWHTLALKWPVESEQELKVAAWREENTTWEWDQLKYDVYFDDTFSVQALVECTQRLIELFAPKLVLGISDEISSTGDLDRIKIVGEVVDAYNARC